MAKKDFKSTNPAMSFISAESIEAVDGKKPKARKTTTTKGKKKEEKAPAGYKPNPEYVETKSKRVQLLVQPSLYSDAKELSKKLGISLNDFIHRAVQEATYNEYVRDRIEEDVEGKR